MSRETRILWIDDLSRRRNTADVLDGREDLSVTFRGVAGKNLSEELVQAFKGRKPDLVIVDHFLDKTQVADQAFARGSTVAQAARERWPSCPIVGITAADKRRSIPISEGKLYDELWSFSDFERMIPRLKIIADGFRQLARMRESCVGDLLKRLRPPKDDLERLGATVPEDLRDGLGDGGLVSDAYGWIRHQLLDEPGFVLDRLWAATFLGIRESSFAKVERLLVAAKYDGVFAFPEAPRWWASQISTILYERFPESVAQPPQELGRQLPRIMPKDYSKCYACGARLPDTVAYLDQLGEQKRPMCVRHTAPHPAKTAMLFFEEPRIMVEDSP